MRLGRSSASFCFSGSNVSDICFGIHSSAGQLDKLVESGPIVAYAGVDATAPSLHVGHLLPLINLLHFYFHRHHVIALV